MQGLADGYFILPNTIGNYLSSLTPQLDNSHEAYQKGIDSSSSRIKKLLSIKGSKSVDDIHKELGKVMWDNVGMSRNKESLNKALELIPKIKDDFWNNVNDPGCNLEFNPELEKAGRLADFINLGELMAKDALHREESCGGHFREEHHTNENEAKRDDENFSYVAAWEHNDKESVLHKEDLVFENVKLGTRSYK